MSQRSKTGLIQEGPTRRGPALLLLALGWLVLFQSLLACRSASAQCEVWRESNLIDADSAMSPVISVNQGIVWTAVVRGTDIELDAIGPDFRAQLPTPEGSGGKKESPTLVSDSLWTVFLAYSQLEGSSREIIFAKSLGGQFGGVLEVTDDQIDDQRPRIALDGGGVAHLVWYRPEQTQVMYWNETLSDPILAFDNGVRPAIAAGISNTVHVVFERSGGLEHATTTSPGVFGISRTIQGASNVTPGSASVAITVDGTVIVAYASGGSVYLAEKAPGAQDFSAPLEFAPGASEPSLFSDLGSSLALTYILGGDVIVRSGVGLTTQLDATTSSDVESAPAVVLDEFSNVHLTFVRGTSATYSTNACVPSANFGVSTMAGSAPLEVEFSDQSEGGVLRYEWDFGDGSTSTSSSPTHTYLERGEFTVRLTVYGLAGGSDTFEVVDLVKVEPPLFLIEIPDQQVLPGQSEVWFPVLASTVESIQGFQVVVRHDDDFLVFLRTELEQTVVESLVPEFFETQLNGDRVEVGCLFDVFPPNDGRVLPAGRDLRLIHLLFNVPWDAPEGAETMVELAPFDPAELVSNVFAVDGASVRPLLRSSTVKVRDADSPPPIFFKRGDVDFNGETDLSDAIRILDFLFGGPAPDLTCLDAGDVQDVGLVDISSAISVLNYLFVGGSSPAVPFPSTGLDPTPDNLGECLEP